MNRYENKAEDFDDDDDEMPQRQVAMVRRPRPFMIYEQAYTAHEYHVYLNTGIRSPSEYTDLFHLLATATQMDVIYIHLNTPGGNLDTGIQLINAITNCEANVVTCLESSAHSLGSLIFLSGKEMIVNDHSVMMIHNFRAGMGGPGHEIAAQFEATMKWFNTLARKIYVPFISETEFTDMLAGKDLWLQAEDIRNRLAKVEEMQKCQDCDECDCDDDDDEDLHISPEQAAELRKLAESIKSAQGPTKKPRRKTTKS